MLVTTVPVKTPLGQQELRLRTGGLGQRHRTLLFLIDGQRPLSEVLSLAHQAGASTRHFEDLVHQGFVEMPMPQVAAEEHSAPITEPGALAAGGPEPPPVVTSVDLDVPAEVVMAMPEAAPAPVSAPPAPPVAPAAAPRPSPAILARLASMRQRKAQPPPPEPLEEARECLLKVIKLDRTVAARQARSRVVSAKAEAVLIDVVWDLERDLSHGQRSHAGLLALQRARELLRLGNTLVQEAIEAGVTDAP